MGTDKTDSLKPPPKSSSDPCKSGKSVVKILQRFVNHGWARMVTDGHG